MNTRPLTRASSDPSDEDAITPNHFLRGYSDIGPSLPASLDDSEEFGKMQWMISESLANLFWKRWTRDYLPELLRRTKWHENEDPLEVRDLVLMVDENKPRNLCIRAVVKEVRPGRDGQVRVAEVATTDFDTKKTATYLRPVAKLCPLGIKMKSGLVSQDLGAGMLGGEGKTSEEIAKKLGNQNEAVDSPELLVGFSSGFSHPHSTTHRDLHLLIWILT